MHDKTLPHEEEVRARLLPFNQKFKCDVRSARERLGLPEGGFESVGDAVRWRVAHCAKHKAGEFICHECGARFRKRRIHCGREVVSLWYQYSLDNPEAREWVRREEFRSFAHSATQVPLYSSALKLVDRYILPGWAFFVTVWYILTDELVFPHGIGEILPYPPPYEPRELRYPVWKYDDKGRWSIEIPVDEYMYKKQWQDLWPTIQGLRDKLREQTGIKPASRKRGIGEKWERQIGRWIEWYQLYLDLGSVDKVANEWVQRHPEHLGKKTRAPFTAEAIRHAIKEIQKMMQPRDQKIGMP